MATEVAAIAPKLAEAQDDKDKMLKATRQVEFYFADSNLPYDKFMWTLYSSSSDHWVPIQTVASFKRMREYTALGTEWVAQALQLSDFLEVDETKTKVRRKTEVTEPKDQFQRSIYAKGFGEEHPTLQEELEQYFNEYGRVNAVRMRRDQDKKFKSSVFVEFADFSTVEKFLGQKATWKGDELLTMSKEAYCDMKVKEKGLTGRAASTRKEVIQHRGFNAFRLMDGGKATTPDTITEKEVYLDFLGHKIRIHKNEHGNGTVLEEDVPLVRGATLRFDGCSGEMSWSEVKEPLKQQFDGKAPFIKYNVGDDFGLVGFHKVLSDADIERVKEAVKIIKSQPITWSIPDEESEKTFQIERAQTAAKNAFASSQDTRGRPGGGRGGKSRGGRGGGRGGRGGRGGKYHGKRTGPSKTEDQPSTGEERGEKRKRAVEPDGGPDTGTRGNNAPPTLKTSFEADSELAKKKLKTNEGVAKPAESE